MGNDQRKYKILLKDAKSYAISVQLISSVILTKNSQNQKELLLLLPKKYENKRYKSQKAFHGPFFITAEYLLIALRGIFGISSLDL